MHRAALLVPQRAVSELQGRHQIAAVDQNNRVAIRGVQVGDRTGEMWVINSGVNAGDRVITEGIDKVRDGTAVNPIPEKMDPAAQAVTQPNTPDAIGRNPVDQKSCPGSSLIAPSSRWSSPLLW